MIAPDEPTAPRVALIGDVGGPLVSKSERHADPDALAVFRSWTQRWLLHVASTIRNASGNVAMITHAGITHSWWTTHRPRKSR